MADKQAATEHKSWPSMSKDELLKELERISAAHRSADQGGIGGATGVSDVIGNVCREQIQQLKDKIEQSKRAQAPAPDAELVKRMQDYQSRLWCAFGQPLNIEYTEAVKRLAEADRDAKWEQAVRAEFSFASGNSWAFIEFHINTIISHLRARLLAPAKTAEERVTVEEVHTTPLNYSANCAYTVMVDGKPAGPLHSTREYAEIYRLGLITTLHKGK